MSSRRSRIGSKSGRIRSTPGWFSSGNSTPQSTMSSRPSYSKTVMLRPTSPRPPSGMTRRPPAAGRRARTVRDADGSQSCSWNRQMRPDAASPARSAATSVVVQRNERAAHVPVVEHAEQLQGCLGGGGSVVGDAHDGVDRGQQPREDARGPRRGRRRTRRRPWRASWSPAAWPTTETTPAPPCASQPRLATSSPRVDGVAELLEPHAAGEVADRVLDRDDGVPPRGGLVGLERDGGAGAPGHVVEHHRQVAGVGRPARSGAGRRPGWACCSTA